MKNAEILAEAISKMGSQLTQKEKRIAAYFQTRPEAVLVESNSDIAQKLGISPMTLTRFFRKLGFDGSADARQQALHKVYGPNSYRIDKRFESDGKHNDRQFGTDHDVLHASIDAALELRETKLWKDVVELTATSDGVGVTGFQTMYFLADGLCRRLAYLRDGVQLIDGIDGVYAGLLPNKGRSATLVIIDIFRYGAHGPLLAKLARARGINVVVFADEFCDWATEFTPYVLRYPAETNFALTMPQGINAGLSLLLQDVNVLLGSSAQERLKELSKAQDHFGLFLD
ncbi:MurR/RpiR family transcriptional regulator [Sulfitobacter marinus]|nr:MurR/RpiR family transcriptional regulator [Sulfitobacter marinus]